MARWSGNKVKLGKKKYKIYRDTGSSYVDGLLVQGTLEVIEIIANIQGSLIYNRMRQMDSGEKSKEAISIRSNQRLYEARTAPNGQLLSADVVEYEGALWEVRECIPYTNLPRTAHDEAIAVRLDESQRQRYLERQCG